MTTDPPFPHSARRVADFGPDHPFTGAAIISSYTRAEAIEDGVLVYVSEWAKEVGLKWPTVVTRRVWDECIGLPDPLTPALENHGQSERGRAHDVLQLAVWAIKATLKKNQNAETAHYQVNVVGEHGRRRLHSLYIHVGPGDEGEPVFTIMVVGED